MKDVIFWLSAVLLSCLIPFQAVTASEVVLTDKTIVLDQGQLSLFEDKNGTLTLDDVRTLYAEGAFHPIPGGVAEGYSASAFWVKTRLERADTSIARWAFFIGPTYLDRVDIYLIHEGQLIGQLALGDQVVDSEHALHQRLHLAGIELPQGQTDVFARLRTVSTSMLLMQVIPEPRVESFIERTIFLEGWLIGILLAILMINTLNGLWLRNTLFLHFVTYEICMIATLVLSTGIFASLFPQYSADEVNRLMQYTIFITGLFAFVFFYRLLSFRSRLRWVVDVMFMIGIGNTLWGLYMTALDRFTEGMAYINWFLMVYLSIITPVLLLQWKEFSLEQRTRVCGFLLFGFFVIGNALLVSGVLGVTRSTVMIAPVMILSFQLCLHFVLVASMRTSEREFNVTTQQAQLATREVELERRQRLSNDMFMAMFSHEVRTPLAVIDTTVQAMQRQDRKYKVEGDDQRNKRYQRIRQSVKRVAELLQLSDIRGQVDQADEAALVRDYDLVALTDEVIRGFGREHGRRIHFAHSDAALQLHDSVPQQAMSVITRNLIDNALKYSPADTQVEVSVDQGQYSTYWTVCDRGRGLTEYAREHMFQRYFRADEASDMPGLGLGLYIVKELADRFGIELLVATGSNGTTVTCSLPAGKSEVEK